MKLDASAPEQFRGRTGRPYLLYKGQWAAARAAERLHRPLLLSGEPGCGKTDFAFALARHVQSEAGQSFDVDRFIERSVCYMRSDSRARDLLYHFDAVRRFGDAQLAGLPEQRSILERVKDAREYVALRPLGRALLEDHREVVLVDEIDKASRDVANDLLRVMEDGIFEIEEVPEQERPAAGALTPGQAQSYRRVMKRAADHAASDRQRQRLWPLVVLTCNDERRLPDAFLRRCVFFPVPEPDVESVQQIMRDAIHQSKEVSTVQVPVQEAAQAFMALRDKDRMSALRRRPSLSELLDWVSVLAWSGPESTEALLGLADALRTDVNPVPWHKLPSWSCLIKRADDARQLGLLSNPSGA